MTAAQVLVLAKEPVPGRVKTRLTPALTPEQAAEVARAALEDTLDAVRRADVAHRVLVLDGLWPADGFVLQPQCGGPLDERLATAFDDAWAAVPLPLLLIGMDTPQVTEVLLDKAVATLLSPGVDAVLGPTEDGGWWAMGLRRPHPELVRGVATSRDDTGAVQRARLLGAGLVVADLPLLRDVDTISDLRPVAALSPVGRFTDAVAQVLA
ncbi:MAG: TIGR04282 family arsenosugar biosynthesis glycosyltransferase [Mycobacteriales bacterium]